jgi:hypothetical protein
MLLFAGLWTLADREGRLEDRPRRIRAELLPYFNVDVDRLLSQLHDRGFLIRYEDSAGRPLLQVTKFLAHQLPEDQESPSLLPAPPAWDSPPQLAMAVLGVLPPPLLATIQAAASGGAVCASSNTNAEGTEFGPTSTTFLSFAPRTGGGEGLRHEDSRVLEGQSQPPKGSGTEERTLRSGDSSSSTSTVRRFEEEGGGGRVPKVAPLPSAARRAPARGSVQDRKQDRPLPDSSPAVLERASRPAPKPAAKSTALATLPDARTWERAPDGEDSDTTAMCAVMEWAVGGKSGPWESTAASWVRRDACRRALDMGLTADDIQRYIAETHWRPARPGYGESELVVSAHRWKHSASPTNVPQRGDGVSIAMRGEALERTLREQGTLPPKRR